MTIWAKPRARQNACLGIKDDALHLRLKALPCEGLANKALLAFMAELLHVPASTIHLLHGATSRHKIVRVPLNDSVQQFIDDLAWLKA